MEPFTWFNALLTLLFGQIGVLGTVLTIFAGYISYLLKLEQADHKETRLRYEVVSEKRIELFGTLVKTVVELKASIDLLATMVHRKR